MNDLKHRIFAAVKDDLDDIEKALADNLNPYLDLVSEVAGHITGFTKHLCNSDFIRAHVVPMIGHIGSEGMASRHHTGSRR